MGGWSARKSLIIVEHVEIILAIELLAACQAIDFLRPLKTTKPLEEIYSLVRSVVKTYDTDRFMSPDIEKICELIRNGKIIETIKPFLEE